MANKKNALHLQKSMIAVAIVGGLAGSIGINLGANIIRDVAPQDLLNYFSWSKPAQQLQQQVSQETRTPVNAGASQVWNDQPAATTTQENKSTFSFFDFITSMFSEKKSDPFVQQRLGSQAGTTMIAGTAATEVTTGQAAGTPAVAVGDAAATSGILASATGEAPLPGNMVWKPMPGGNGIGDGPTSWTLVPAEVAPTPVVATQNVSNFGAVSPSIAPAFNANQSAPPSPGLVILFTAGGVPYATVQAVGNTATVGTTGNAGGGGLYSAAGNCGDGGDNDGDGMIDMDDTNDCLEGPDDHGLGLYGPCNDGIDNDGDNKIDFNPMDIANSDPDCLRNNETHGASAPASLHPSAPALPLQGTTNTVQPIIQGATDNVQPIHEGTTPLMY